MASVVNIHMRRILLQPPWFLTVEEALADSFSVEIVFFPALILISHLRTEDHGRFMPLQSDCLELCLSDLIPFGRGAPFVPTCGYCFLQCCCFTCVFLWFSQSSVEYVR